MIFIKSAIITTIAFITIGLGGCAYENTVDIGPGQVIPTAAGHIIGRLKIEVIREPRVFEGHAELKWYSIRDGRWLVMDGKKYTKHNLPAAGRDEWMKPFLEAHCVKGKWQMTMHFYGVTQDGTVVPPTMAYWPGPGPKSYFRIKKCD